MKFKLEFNCDNATFDNDKIGEIASIIKVTANRFSDMHSFTDLKPSKTKTPVYDDNGNKIGFFMIGDK